MHVSLSRNHPLFPPKGKKSGKQLLAFNGSFQGVNPFGLIYTQCVKAVFPEQKIKPNQ